MEIQIVKILLKTTNGDVISFTSEYGLCEGLWEGTLPQTNNVYDVEIDILDDLRWGTNVALANKSKCALEKINGNIKIVAEVESIQEDNYCALRLGNTVIVAEIKNLPLLEKGSLIELRAKEIRLFNSNL